MFIDKGVLHEGQVVIEYAFFLDIQKTYDSVWRDDLWYKLWDIRLKGRIGV